MENRTWPRGNATALPTPMNRLDLLHLAAAARRDPTLIPNHEGAHLPDRIRAEIRGIQVLLTVDVPEDYAQRLHQELGEYRHALTAYTDPTPLDQAVPTYNPRYLAYCAAHGRSLGGMLALDRQRYPGGPNVGYMTWLSAQGRAFDAARTSASGNPHAEAVPGTFDAWLDAQALTSTQP